MYNAKSRSVPTRDAVFVDVDLSINLRIGPDIERVEQFVYKMGAERLDAYLNFQVNESIRSLVYDVTHDKASTVDAVFHPRRLKTRRWSPLRPSPTRRFDDFGHFCFAGTRGPSTMCDSEGTRACAR